MRNLALAFALVAVVPLSASAAELVAAARIPSDARDSRNETLGGIGSGMALVPGSWAKNGSGYRARLAMLPDRGWNTEGTSDYQARLQMFDIVLTPKSGDGHEDGLLLPIAKRCFCRMQMASPPPGSIRRLSAPRKARCRNCRQPPMAV